MITGLKAIQDKALPILKKAEVSRSAVFGSYARGDNSQDSDIDMLVELPNEKSIFDFIDLKMKLEKILGKEVDLVEYSGLKPRLQKYILNTQISIL